MQGSCLGERRNALRFSALRLLVLVEIPTSTRVRRVPIKGGPVGYSPKSEQEHRSGETVGGRERTRTEKEKMLAGELYDARAPELQMELAATHRWLARYNAALDASAADRRELSLGRPAAVCERAVIRPPFHCDYGFSIRF